MQRLQLLMGCALLLADVASTPGAVRYVSIGAMGAADGSSWADAHTNLTEALVAAQAGDDLWLMQGRYVGANVMPAMVSLYGGFSGSELSQSAASPAQFPTILDGQGDAPVLTVNNGVTIDGFTITGGNGGAGPGVYMDKKDPVTISRCVFTNNVGTGYGGALFYISREQASHLTVSRCAFYNNVTTSQGGGIGLIYWTSNVRIENCIFSGNTAANGGAIAAVNGSDRAGVGVGPAKVWNCTMVNNTATAIGHELAVGAAGSGESSASFVDLYNCILWGHDAAMIYGKGGSTVTVTTCAMQNGTNSVFVHASTGATIADDGQTIDADPLFADRDGPDNVVGTTDDNLRLSDGSPCLDVGTLIGAPLVDYDGTPRPLDNGIELGAYEFGRPPGGLMLHIR